MVFIHVPRHRRVDVEPTPEEAALLRDALARGVPAEDLEAALAARGVAPDRARDLARALRPRSPADRARAVAMTLLWVVMGLTLAAGERLVRPWLRERLPGWEWIGELLLPLLVGLAALVVLLSRVRRARRAREEGLTRADQIDRRPIG